MKSISLHLLLLSMFIASCSSERPSEEGKAANTAEALAFLEEGNMAEDGDKMDDAISLYSKAIAADATLIDAYKARADLYMYMEKYELAVEDWKLVLVTTPDDIEARFQLGLGLALSKKLEDAVRVLTEVLERDSTYTNAYYKRGLVRIEMGDKEGGCADLYTADHYGTSEVYFNTLQEMCVETRESAN